MCHELSLDVVKIFNELHKNELLASRPIEIQQLKLNEEVGELTRVIVAISDNNTDPNYKNLVVRDAIDESSDVFLSLLCTILKIYEKKLNKPIHKMTLEDFTTIDSDIKSNIMNKLIKWCDVVRKENRQKDKLCR